MLKRQTREKSKKGEYLDKKNVLGEVKSIFHYKIVLWFNTKNIRHKLKVTI